MNQDTFRKLLDDTLRTVQRDLDHQVMEQQARDWEGEFAAWRLILIADRLDAASGVPIWGPVEVPEGYREPVEISITYVKGPDG